jgi:hypothetical protein
MEEGSASVSGSVQVEAEVREPVAKLPEARAGTLGTQCFDPRPVPVVPAVAQRLIDRRPPSCMALNCQRIPVYVCAQEAAGQERQDWKRPVREVEVPKLENPTKVRRAADQQPAPAGTLRRAIAPGLAARPRRPERVAIEEERKLLLAALVREAPAASRPPVRRIPVERDFAHPQS